MFTLLKLTVRTWQEAETQKETHLPTPTNPETNPLKKKNELYFPY